MQSSIRSVVSTDQHCVGSRGFPTSLAGGESSPAEITSEQRSSVSDSDLAAALTTPRRQRCGWQMTAYLLEGFHNLARFFVEDETVIYISPYRKREVRSVI